ncbi:NlpC/P60 family protein [Streptomyces sp. NBC_01023]|uniref:C40 family peptidase n=1 Tax=unclassified Streptomyces TaxID=2593676 RepID=UPI0030DF43A0|nr:NlpC/P60 family protein [Streptomyces sp. NBC_01023]
MNVSTGGGQLRGRATVAALVCAIALIPGPSYAAPNDPGPGNDSSIERIRTELDGLYRQAEVATEAYDAANEKATKQTKRLASLQTELARAEGRVNDLNDLVGAAARTQYRGGFLASTGIQLLLGDHADQALNEASQTRQAMQGIANATATQKTARTELDGRTDAAAKELRELKRTRADKAGAKKKIEQKIAEAERIESGLEEKDTRKLAQLEKQHEDESKSKWTGSGGSSGRGGSRTKVSGAAGKAVGFAMAQIGKPYIWGAVGPSSYDCSGLTSAAWAAAGHPIPRTSQAQWQGLTRVSLASARPGDLIIYYNATHVGMYIGGGQVVHAPRPGRTITTAPAASMPILGVVRPGV